MSKPVDGEPDWRPEVVSELLDAFCGGPERLGTDRQHGVRERLGGTRFLGSVSPPPPAEQTIDNGQPGYSEFNGGWASSGLKGLGGSGSRYSANTGAGVTWRPSSELEAGWYTVELYNVAHSTNTTNARLTIKHAGITETRSFDQRNTVNGFKRIGTFYFDGGGSEAVTLQNLGGGVLRADALRFRKFVETIDNGEPGYSEFGSGWATSTLEGVDGSRTRYTPSTGSGVRWRPAANLTPGWYTVEVFNVSNSSNTTNAHITINHAGVTDTATLDQRNTPTGFVAIGTFYFDGRSSDAVTLTNGGGGMLRADAVRFRPAEETIDNGEPGYSEFGGGWASSGLTGFEGSGTRFSSAAGAGATWRPGQSFQAGWYSVHLYNVAHPTNTTSARVTIAHAGVSETRTLNLRARPNGFVVVGTFYSDGRGSEAVTLQNLGGGVLRTDALRFRHAAEAVDNGEPGYSEFGGGWVGSGLTGSNGSSTRFTPNTGAGATWRPSQNLAAGWYAVELFNVQHAANTTNARITVKHAGITETRTLDQRATRTGFVTIGAFYFDGRGSEAVTLANGGGGNLRADAVRFRPTPAPEAREPEAAPSTQSNPTPSAPGAFDASLTGSFDFGWFDFGAPVDDESPGPSVLQEPTIAVIEEEPATSTAGTTIGVPLETSDEPQSTDPPWWEDAQLSATGLALPDDESLDSILYGP